MSPARLAGGAFLVGLMVATAVRSFIPAVTLVTAPLLCEGTKAEVHSSWYRCLDGVSASSPSIMPMATEGMPDIFVVIGLTTLIYGSGLFLIGLLAKLVMGSSKS